MISAPSTQQLTCFSNGTPGRDYVLDNDDPAARDLDTLDRFASAIFLCCLAHEDNWQSAL